jgi:hypothetical protein
MPNIFKSKLSLNAQQVIHTILLDWQKDAYVSSNGEHIEHIFLRAMSEFQDVLMELYHVGEILTVFFLF